MSRFRSAVRFLTEHWFLVIAVAVNLAIAAPAGAVRYDNDLCDASDGGGIEPCCTTCWFFCDCDIEFEGDVD